MNNTWIMYSIYRRMLNRLEDALDYGFCDFKITGKCKSRNGIWNWKDNLELVHFHVRTKFNTKYSESNTDVGCIRCHNYFHQHKTKHKAWKLKQLGKQDYKKLLIASQILVRKSDQRIKETALREWLRGEIKKLEQ